MFHELSQRFDFEAAHTLERDRDAEPSRRIHGHTYHAEVTVRGQPDPRTGMLMDVGELRSHLATVRDLLDHRLLNEVDGLGKPTLERLCGFIAKRLRGPLPGLASVRVWRASGDHCKLVLCSQASSAPSMDAMRPGRHDPDPSEVEVASGDNRTSFNRRSTAQVGTGSSRPLRVALAMPAEQESLIDLLCEIHRYYNDGRTPSREAVRTHLLENLLSRASPHRLVVATLHDGTVVGLAAFTLVYSLVDFDEDKRKHCQLKELYVSAGERSKGAGRALMSWVANHARENGCHRIDWPVKASNARGIAFYESLGAERVVDRLSYRISEPGLSRLARIGA